MQLKELKCSLNKLTLMEANKIMAEIRNNRNTPVVKRKAVKRTPKEIKVSAEMTMTKKQEEFLKSNPEILKRMIEKLKRENQ